MMRTRYSVDYPQISSKAPTSSLIPATAGTAQLVQVFISLNKKIFNNLKVVIVCIGVFSKQRKFNKSR